MTRLVLIAVTTVAAGAQQAGPEDLLDRQASAEARRLIESPSYRDKAWGAYLAGRHGLRELAGEVSSQLAALSELTVNTLRADTPEYAAIQATLDAAIRLDLPADAAVLLLFQKQWTDEAVILLAQDPQKNREALLGMTDQPDAIGARWVAVHNLLVESRSAGIAARILSEVGISHVFQVTDGSFPPGEGGGFGGGALCCGLAGQPRDLPPAGVYQLILTPGRGDVLVAPGTHPVFYRRTTGCRGLPFRQLDYQQYRLEYLARLSGLPVSAIQQALTPSTVIRWINLIAYRRQVNAAIASQRAAIAEIVERLETAGLLEHDETAALQLTIVIDQEDQRQGGEGLPNLLPVPVRIN